MRSKRTYPKSGRVADDQRALKNKHHRVKTDNAAAGRRKALKPSKMREVGKAGEHIVCADLIMNGYPAFIASEGLPYDLVAEVGQRMIRIQVKSTQRPMNPIGNASKVYRFSSGRKGYKEDGRTPYSKSEIDIIAYAALDSKIIAYKKPSSRSGCIVDFRLKSWPLHPCYEVANQRRTAAAKMLRDGYRYCEISRTLGVSSGHAYNLCHGPQSKMVSYRNLMEDMTLERALGI